MTYNNIFDGEYFIFDHIDYSFLNEKTLKCLNKFKFTIDDWSKLALYYQLYDDVYIIKIFIEHHANIIFKLLDKSDYSMGEKIAYISINIGFPNVIEKFKKYYNLGSVEFKKYQKECFEGFFNKI